ncbi:MAG: protein-L-isoaspartate O-methyltransferase [Alphaproteobacteria bacterium]|nr:protein-L-isoaspartate O-methyltransferase [Alphaproteobacteria bacterium]MBV9693473.1 protein-L-isoaspartate O-methyltransferase [Alphaproteobacteria bacterium]
MQPFAAQRLTMVETQVRPNDVTDPALCAAMAEVPRERFVPAAKLALAYSDLPVEVSPGRFLLDPRTFSKMVALAQIEPDDSVLDVGSATGYSAAVLGRLARSVIALEQDAELVRLAYGLCPAVGASNVIVTQGPLSQGLKAKAPYNVIVVNGAIEERPDTLLGQLAEGGRLVAVVSEGPVGKARLFLREHGRIGTRDAFDAICPALVGFSRSVGFVF